MHWSTICPVLIELFTRLARPDGDTPPDGWTAEWTERSKSFTHPEVAGDLYLKVTSCVGIGEDEIRRAMGPAPTEDDPEAEDLFATQCGLRRFTLQVQARVHEHADDAWAMQTLEQIRTRLRRRSSLDTLLAVEVALVEMRPSVKATVTVDRRRVSVGNLDVILSAAINDLDPVPVGWVERIRVTSNMKVGDVRLPDPLNVTDELMPPAEPDP